MAFHRDILYRKIIDQFSRQMNFLEIHFVGSIPRFSPLSYFLFNHRGHCSLKFLMAQQLLTAFVPTVLWGTGKQYGTLRGRLAYRLKEQKRSRSKQNTLQIKGLMYGLSPLHSVQKNHRLVQSVDELFWKYTSWVRFPDSVPCLIFCSIIEGIAP